MILNPDFKEFFQYLNANDVRYLVVGGYAVALHGYPRYTKDIDVWIDLAEDNAARIIDALDEFGFGSVGLRSDDFLEQDQVIQLGYPPNRIDILTSLHGVTFDTCYEQRVVVPVGDDIEVSFIDLDGLKRNKRATGRLQDRADLENLDR